MTITTLHLTFTETLDRIATGRYGVDDLVRALAADGDDERELFDLGDAARRESMGEAVHLRALIEFSNYCSRFCEYCGLRSPNVQLERYRMEPAEIIETAVHAASLGYRTVVLQSGEDAWYDRAKIAQVVRGIKARCDIALTLCVGERPTADYAAWREAGADRYLLRIETTNRALYRRLHPHMSFDNRLACLRALRDLGYQVGSGVLVGLPGQTLQMLAEDLRFMGEFRPDMVGYGPLIPHDQTPLASSPKGSVDVTLRMMAITRLLLPQAYIVSTTALGTLDPLGREKGLQVGGNVVMPNVTPQRYRAFYEIYPDKICIDESAEKCRGCIELRVRSIGRHIATDPGHAPGC
jgi:biotin synthase